MYIPITNVPLPTVVEMVESDNNWVAVPEDELPGEYQEAICSFRELYSEQDQTDAPEKITISKVGDDVFMLLANWTTCWLLSRKASGYDLELVCTQNEDGSATFHSLFYGEFDAEEYWR